MVDTYLSVPVKLRPALKYVHSASTIQNLLQLVEKSGREQGPGQWRLCDHSENGTPILKDKVVVSVHIVPYLKYA